MMPRASRARRPRLEVRPIFRLSWLAMHGSLWRKPMNNAPELRPLGETLGTEAPGVDLSHPIDEPTFTWIAQVFAEHPVLVFRDQQLGAAELAAFGRRFGTPRRHALFSYRYPGGPEVSWVRNVDDAGDIDWYGVKRATDWHTDSTYEPELPLLAMLHALEIPAAKGGTMFADMRAAYDALSPAMKDRLCGLVGLHGRTDGPAGARLYDPEEEMRPAAHKNDDK